MNDEGIYKVKIYKRQLQCYIPRSITKISKEIPEKVQTYYTEYPYEIYGDPIIRKKLALAGIRENQLEYQECYEAASYAYLYSIHRCAYCNYERTHVENYIRKMISIAIIWGMVISNEDYYFCKATDQKRVCLDACGSDRW